MSDRDDRPPPRASGTADTARLTRNLAALGQVAPVRADFVAELERRLLRQAATNAAGGPSRARRAAGRIGSALGSGAQRLAIVALLAVALLALTLARRGALAPDGRRAASASLPPAPTASSPVAAPAAGPGAAAPAPIYVAQLRGAVDPISARYLHRVVTTAQANRGGAIVLLIDTPGGLDSAMRRMVQDLLSTPLPTVVFVAPAGARDASAGVFITQAATIVAMAPGTTIGAAHPVNGDGSNLTSDMRDKVTNDAAAYIVGIARQRGRNQTWVDAAVRQSVALDAQQAVEQQVADLLAPDLATLLATIDGRTVTTTAGAVTVRTAGAPVVTVEMHLVERLFQALVDPTVAYLLLSIGFFALLIELFHPGAVAPGVTGVVCLVLAFVAFASLPLNWGGVILILAALVLFVIDVQATTHGALTVAGLACFVLGSLLLYTPPGPRSPALPVAGVAPPVLLAVAALIAGLSLTVVGAAIRVRRQPPIVAWSPTSGAVGVASTALEPQGVVRVRGQLWSARLKEGTLEPGQPVRVLARSGLTLDVEPVESDAATGEEFPDVG